MIRNILNLIIKGNAAEGLIKYQVSFDALFDWRSNVIETDWTFHEREDAGIVHRAELDVLQSAKISQIHLAGIETSTF